MWSNATSPIMPEITRCYDTERVVEFVSRIGTFIASALKLNAERCDGRY